MLNLMQYHRHWASREDFSIAGHISNTERNKFNDNIKCRYFKGHNVPIEIVIICLFLFNYVYVVIRYTK